MISCERPEDFVPKFEVVGCVFEHDSKILILHRQDHKPQGNMWSVPGGKVEKGESIEQAIIREIKEEMSLDIQPEKLIFFKSYYVTHHGYSLIYHVFHYPLKEVPHFDLNQNEHKNAKWLDPKEVVLMKDLMPDEDFCLKDFYKIS